MVGEEHYNTARKTTILLQNYKDLQDIIAILGMDELSDEDKLVVESLDAYNDSYHNLSLLLSSLQVLLVNM